MRVAANIVLHQFEISPFCDKVRRALHFKGLEYQVEEVSLLRTLRGAVAKLSPIGKLPVLEHDGECVADSSHILDFLEERQPKPPLLPADGAQRAQARLLARWADESLYFDEMRLRFLDPEQAKRFVPQLLHKDPAWFRAIAGLAAVNAVYKTTKAQGVGRRPPQDFARYLEAKFGWLGNLLGEREWLVGEAISLADIAVRCQVAPIAQTPRGEELLQARPNLARWTQRVDAATLPDA